ncbi:hypothetical protein MCOR27_009797 [Pyricularia oryzae]|uniref:NADPH-dependent 1-acyldihydroxyacetone phosphate reductase n=5 Tax=Pyricularia TaxID=48558 RepID=A0ABQ8N9Y6_PYRGI|nr:uncharacterized protein MGG_16186 [Pyricularia oryzae 70-15]ELQ43701.1 NADPH-dependent 1-acyldihydroxyacetone phosphate reductase [Pyricularia oryzae Y34]KAH8842296.1 hypothetical protein MCOR01_006212 [Pyricularia oryzae]KAI6293680.1 hypothetical protein MCOR33_008970 [Pyricularia grisea]EHA56946.1 hypothetical protein MGG_16186 [Pyricularia oryzae 70-15]KAH9435531.1 hypothetical protein MCOR02_004456 [Pyricularia oryzae]
MALKPGQKTVLITGCTPGGIGHALALEYHAKGLHVIATARRPEVMKDLAEAGMTTLPLDVTKTESIEECKKAVSELTGGRLDILVNNAGGSIVVPATDMDLDDVRWMFEANVFGVMAMVKAFAPLLIATKGLIIMISSLSSVTPYLFASAYSASKGALNSYSRVLRMEMRPFGVRVMVSMTGTVRSLNKDTQVHKPLPADSLYQRVKDVFEWRLNYSQIDGTVDTRKFASQLVRKSLKPEWPIMLRAWFGRPDWFWGGGLAGRVWLARLLTGEWLIDMQTWNKFKLWKLEAFVKQDEAKKLK